MISDTESAIHVGFIYGLHNMLDRRPLWDELSASVKQCSGE